HRPARPSCPTRRSSDLPAREHRNPNGDRWPAADDAFLREWAGVMGDVELAERLGRSVASIRVRRRRKGYPGPMVHPDFLTAQGRSEEHTSELQSRENLV